MAGASLINTDLMVAGYLRVARKKADPLSWLQSQHLIAFEAVQNGDEFISSSSTEGGGSTAERQMPATTALQILELALQVFESQEAATQGGYDMPGTVRWADFSQYPSTLG